MPKFANEQYGGRQQVEVNRQDRELTQVVAKPVDTYARPAESDLARLSEALNGFMPIAQRYADNREKEQGQAEMVQGQTAQLRGEAQPPEASPYWKYGYQTMLGSVHGNELAQKMREEATKHMDDPTFNPTTFSQKFIQENTQGVQTPAILQTLNRHLEQGMAQVQGEFEKYQVKKLREEEQTLVGKNLSMIFDEPANSPAEYRARYDQKVAEMKASGIDLTRTDAGAIFGRMLLARAYEGDPEIIKVARERDANGVSLEMANPELFTEIAKAQQQATHLYDKKQIEANQRVNSEEAGGWEQDINKDPLKFGNPFDYFMQRWSKYGNVRDESTFLHWANKVASAQEAFAKAQGHMWDAESNPRLTGLYWQDEKFRKQFTESKFVPIWQGVNQNDPQSVLNAVRQSATIMNTYQGAEDPYLKSFFDRSTMSLDVDPKTKIEKAPMQLVVAAQAYRYLHDNGMAGVASKIFDDRTALAIRQFGALSEVMDSTAAYQKVLTAMRPENEKRALNQEERLQMKTSVTGFLKPWLGKNYDMNGEEITGRAMFLADSLYKSTNMEPKEIKEYVVEQLKGRLVDVGSGKVFYSPSGNVDNLPPVEVFKSGANQLISDYIAAHPDAGPVTLTSYADGKSFGIVNKMREVQEVVSIDDIRKGYEKSTYASGSIYGDQDSAQKIRSVLNSKGQGVTGIELAQMSGYANRLFNSGALSSKELMAFNDLRSTVRRNDEQRAMEFRRVMDQNRQMFQQGKQGYADDFRLDVANPGGKNLRTIDYAMEYAKRGDVAASFTMMNEGMMLTRYKDPNGKDFNIGFGFNMSAHGKEGTFKALTAAGVPKENLEGVYSGQVQITPDQAVRLYKHTVKAEYEPMARKAFGQDYDVLPPNAKAVLTDLAYACGNKVGEYKTAIEMLRKGQFDEAGKVIKLTYLNKNGERVEDTRRMSMYRRLLAGDNTWMSYLTEVHKRTPN